MWAVMTSIRYPRYTRDSVDQGILNVSTMSEIKCSICRTPTIIFHSNSDNRHHLLLVLVRTVSGLSYLILAAELTSEMKPLVMEGRGRFVNGRVCMITGNRWSTILYSINSFDIV